MTGRPVALVTGASSGLGLELARIIAADDHDVVLAARSSAALQLLADELQRRLGIAAIPIPTDLSLPDAGPALARQLAARGIDIDVLVNNAGFTLYGPLERNDEYALVELARVNVEALTMLSRSLLPGMLERGRGMIVNMASNAAFQPGPLMAAYYASKAYVLSFSLALSEEVRGRGVTVTALCPGPTATGLQARGGMEDSKLVAGRGLSSAAEVAAWGWAQAKRGRPFAVHGTRWRAFAFGSRLLPRSTAARIVMRAQEQVPR
jgi:short-subunit dehydrogenase